MRSSVALFDALADDYDEHFAAPLRRAYDDLAWEAVEALLPDPPGTVIDAGCGVGRWAERFAGLGHRVVGIEQAPRMVQRARQRLAGDRCRVLHSSIEQADVDEASADLVIAMGSLQYTTDPRRSVARLAGWARAGGWVAVLVDSRTAMAVEKVRSGRHEEGLAEMRARRGQWRQAGEVADVHLLDRAELEDAFREAGLTEVRSAGLLVSAGVFGRDWLLDRLRAAPDDVMALERRLGGEPGLADLGKQLLVVGRRPVAGRPASG